MVGAQGDKLRRREGEKARRREGGRVQDPAQHRGPQGSTLYEDVSFDFLAVYL